MEETKIAIAIEIMATKSAEERKETMARVIAINDKLCVMVEVIKKVRIEEEIADSIFVWEAVAQMVAKMEAIINVTMEIAKSDSSMALAPNS